MSALSARRLEQEASEGKAQASGRSRSARPSLKVIEHRPLLRRIPWSVATALVFVVGFLFMGLIGVMLASVVGIFWHNDALQFVISFIGVIVFTGLTVYDAQRLKAMALSTPAGQIGSYQIVGALTLYLDFVNLFLFLLRFTGSRRD